MASPPRFKDAEVVIFRVHADGWAEIGGSRFPCALGEAGVVSGGTKREGDGASPAGVWPLRRLLFRPDRGPAPPTRLPIAALRLDDGWCDAPGDPRYNRQVTLPHAASAESLWREDGLYDLILVVGHNDSPPRPGAGSAIFVHLASEGFAPTKGCVALHRPALERLLAIAAPGDALEILSGEDRL